MRAKISSAIRTAKTEVRRTITRQREALSALAKHQLAVTQVAGMVLHFLDPAKARTAEFWLSTWGGEEVTLTFYVSGLDSFKDPAVVKACAFLNGIFEDCETTDCASARNRDVTFRGGMGPLKVKLALYADSESASCKRIEVGREYREEVQYKMVCED